MREHKLYQVIVNDDKSNILGKYYIVAQSRRDAIRAFVDKQSILAVSLLLRFSCTLDAYEVTDEKEIRKHDAEGEETC